MRINTMPFMVGLGIFCAVAATVLLYIFILPEKKREKLPKVLKIVHDIFNFKDLMLEMILKALYVFSSVACVIVGVLMIFGFSIYTSSWSGDTYTTWYGGWGILLMIGGPIVLRLVFEAMMMFVLLVKNTIEINKKMPKEVEAEEPVAIEE